MEQVGEKMSTTCTHRDANCLLKHTFTKDNKYVVNQKLDHVDDISFIEQYKIRPLLAQGMCIFRKTVGPSPLICPST